MPTFDFRCSACQTLFEATLTFGSKKKPLCPACGSKKTEKLMTPPLGIHFKGSGFYKTDSAPKNVDTQPKTAPPKPEKNDAKPKDGTTKST